MYIIFSNRHEIRRLNVHNNTLTSLVSGLRNTIALDFHYEKSLIFWTDVIDDKIYRGEIKSNCESIVFILLYWTHQNQFSLLMHVDFFNSNTVVCPFLQQYISVVCPFLQQYISVVCPFIEQYVLSVHFYISISVVCQFGKQ